MGKVRAEFETSSVTLETLSVLRVISASMPEPAASFAMLEGRIAMSIQLAPDSEAGLLAEAAGRGIDVTTRISAAVRAYLGETPVAAIRPRPSCPRAAELAWASRPEDRYIGQWVVLEGSRVVASGPNPKQLYEDARADGDLSPFLIVGAPHGEQPFAGGWLD